MCSCGFHGCLSVRTPSGICGICMAAHSYVISDGDDAYQNQQMNGYICYTMKRMENWYLMILYPGQKMKRPWRGNENEEEQKVIGAPLIYHSTNLQLKKSLRHTWYSMMSNLLGNKIERKERVPLKGLRRRHQCNSLLQHHFDWGIVLQNCITLFE